MDVDGAAWSWPGGGVTEVPYAIYTDPGIFAREMERIFAGSGWAYVGLEAEIPEPGDYLVTRIGDRSVVIARDEEGAIHGFANRCAHRGVKVCRQRQGNARLFVCPYHQWSYDARGRLRGVPFINGVRQQGGMPEGFAREDHNLPGLSITSRGGVIFASFSATAPRLEKYLGDTNLAYFDRVFDGRPLKVLGYSRQRIPGNWKLMFENIKDPYHASLLHVFLVTFGLFRADQPAQVRMDASGAHGLLISRRGEQRATDDTREMSSMKDDFALADARLLDPVKEFGDDATVVMQTIWPNLIVQQQSNTLALRQIQPLDPGRFELHWTFFGYGDDDEDMTLRRLRQANLMSSAGLVSADDSEVIKLAQDGVDRYRDDVGIMLMGGRGTDDENHMVTETAIRAFYGHYRRVMGL
ncbi:MAG: Rieske 2Fe-2S domain-containing protein [Pseudomonadales bacterium]|nr:Rieske 2Fe-2S domain-containing protein [Pseudomonadales bacterium]NIX06746.1 Rieske 2Fe-2S domain-containing protein [Pseudomonadales bacterium]